MAERLTPELSQIDHLLRRVLPVYHGINAAGALQLEHAGVPLAIALQLLLPAGRIAASWADDGSGVRIAYAVFYDPATSAAWDGAGHHHDFEWRIANWHAVRADLDADPVELAEAVGMPFDPAAPWRCARVRAAAEFAIAHLLAA